MDLLIHTAIMAHLITSEIDAQLFDEAEVKDDHIDALPFTTSREGNPVNSWSAYLQILGVTDWEETLLP